MSGSSINRSQLSPLAGFPAREVFDKLGYTDEEQGLIAVLADVSSSGKLTEAAVSDIRDAATDAIKNTTKPMEDLKWVRDAISKMPVETNRFADFFGFKPMDAGRAKLLADLKALAEQQQADLKKTR